MLEGEQIRDMKWSRGVDRTKTHGLMMVMTEQSLILMDASDGEIMQRVNFRNFELIIIKHFDSRFSLILAQDKFKEDRYLLSCETLTLNYCSSL